MRMGFLMVLWKNNMVKLAVVTVLVLFAFRYVLPFLLPFVIAFLFVLCFRPILRKIHRKVKISEGILAGILMGMIALLVLLAAWFLLGRIMELIGDYRQNEAYFRECCLSALDGCCNFIGDKINVNPENLRQKVLEGTDHMMVSLRNDFAPKAIDASYSYAGAVFEGVFCIVVTVIAVILFIKDYDSIKEKIRDNVFFIRVREMSRKIILLLKIYVKAQCIIVLCVSAVAMAGLFACGTERWYFWGILTGFLDMLPFVGSGIVLLPIAVFDFIQGKVWQGLGCLLIYGICAFLRQILEPKLIGDKINIYPIFILLSVFFGLHFFHIGGIILGPVSLFLIREIYQEVKEKKTSC